MAVRSTLADTLLADAASLRRLACSLLAGDDADDAVQEAFVAALEQRADLLRHPAQWLRGTVRNLTLMGRRCNARRSARERLAAKPEADPHDPAALAAEAELVRNIGAAVHALAEPYRTAILLRFWHDLSVDAIAGRLGLPRNTVRSRLQRGLARLRKRLDRQHGNRHGWAALLGAFQNSSPYATFTVCLMNKKLLVGAAAMMLVLVASSWLLGEPGPVMPGVLALGPGAVTVERTAVAEETGPAMQRNAVPAAPLDASTTGTLIVHVQHRDEPKAAAGMAVLVCRAEGDFRVDVLHAITDAAGTARFDGVAPGPVSVRCSAGGGAKAEARAKADVRAGATDECLVELRGASLNGIVVDATGFGVAGALVEAGFAGSSGGDADVAAVTATDGTFVLRNAQESMLLGARKSGYVASHLYPIARGLETATTVRIVLGVAGGCVSGTVLEPDGKPVRGAVVRVGEGRLDAVLPSQGATPLPAQVRTDADGCFTAIGLPVGTCPMQVRALGLAPWAGTCEVVAGSTASVHVRLEVGVTCSGTVRIAGGDPVAGVGVRSGRDGDFLQYFARTAADGSFTLQGLPTWECEVWAAERLKGKASARVRGDGGSTVRCDLMLSNGQALRGQVTDENGKPVLWAEVVCEAEGSPHWRQMKTSDDTGRFVVPDCPEGRLLLVKATARQRVPFRQQNVDPQAGELLVQLPLDTSPRARITGRIVGPAGQRAMGVQIVAIGPPRSSQREDLDLKSDDGSFAIEVTAGSWDVRVYSRGFPTAVTGKRELEAGGAWDLGTIELVRGGTVVVHDRGLKGLDYSVLDARERFQCALYIPGLERRSELLAPGEYLLFVRGEDTALHVLPFAVRPGEETVLDVQPVAGVRQRFEFLPAPAAKLPPRLSFTVRRAGKLIGHCGCEAGGGPLVAEVNLVPGEYVISSKTEKVDGGATFTVGREEGPAVRVEVR